MGKERIMENMEQRYKDQDEVRDSLDMIKAVLGFIPLHEAS